METIKSIIGGFLQKKRLDKTLEVYQVFEVWEQAVGKRIARHSQPKRFKDGILWIAVDNATWMQQLSLLSEEICAKVIRSLEAPRVERVRFQIGEVSNRSRARTNSTDKPPEWTKTILAPATKQAIDQVVAPLPDEELKERLKSLFKKNSQLLHYHDKS